MTEKTNFKVCFRVDSSLEIGSGHVMRCITFARELQKKHDAVCVFITRALEGNLNKLIQQHNFNIYLLPLTSTLNYGYHPHAPAHASWLNANWKLDAELTRSYISEIDADYLVVDHYALDSAWEKAVTSNNKVRLLVIDDLADRPHTADILLDYTLNRQRADYASLVNKECKLLTGLKYVLLREEFSLGRQLKKFKKQEQLNIFINMGGVDKDNYTLRICEMLSKIGEAQNFNYLIVVGENYKHFNELKKFLEHNFTNFQTFKNVRNICEIMRCSDLAISAMGSTTWELISQGIPCLILSIAENQKIHLKVIEQSKIAEVLTDLTYFGFKTQFLNFTQNKEGLKKLSMKSYEAIDAKGTNRVAKILMSYEHGISRDYI